MHRSRPKPHQKILIGNPYVQYGIDQEARITDFIKIKYLGEGSFGKVEEYALRSNPRRRLAIKTIPKSIARKYNMVRQMNQELKILYRLNHPNIAKLFSHFEDQNSIYMVQEFADAGDLFRHLDSQPQKRFEERRAAKIIGQLVSALNYIHTMGIMHRDIKPENIFLCKGEIVKLGDFGWSSFFSDSEIRTTFCGTPDYLAPEMVESGHAHEQAVDVWAVGILAYELIKGIPPFHAKSFDQTMENIRRGRFSLDSNFSRWGKDFISKILRKDPQKRPTTRELLHHPWLQNAKLPPVQSKNRPKFIKYVRQRLAERPKPVVKNQLAKTNITDTFQNLIKNKPYMVPKLGPNFTRAPMKNPVDIEVNEKDLQKMKEDEEFFMDEEDLLKSINPESILKPVKFVDFDFQQDPKSEQNTRPNLRNKIEYTNTSNPSNKKSGNVPQYQFSKKKLKDPAAKTGRNVHKVAARGVYSNKNNKPKSQRKIIINQASSTSRADAIVKKKYKTDRNFYPKTAYKDDKIRSKINKAIKNQNPLGLNYESQGGMKTNIQGGKRHFKSQRQLKTVNQPKSKILSTKPNINFLKNFSRNYGPSKNKAGVLENYSSQYGVQPGSQLKQKLAKQKKNNIRRVSGNGNSRKNRVRSSDKKKNQEKLHFAVEK